MTKKEMINNIVMTAQCAGFALTPNQIEAISKMTVARIRAGYSLLCTGLADAVIDNGADVARAAQTVHDARVSML